MKSNKLAKNGEEAEQSKTDSQNVQQEQQAAKKTKNETKTPYHSMSKKSKKQEKNDESRCPENTEDAITNKNASLLDSDNAKQFQNELDEMLNAMQSAREQNNQPTTFPEGAQKFNSPPPNFTMENSLQSSNFNIPPPPIITDQK